MSASPVRLRVWLPPSLSDRLRACSAASGHSATTVVIHALEQYLSDEDEADWVNGG